MANDVGPTLTKLGSRFGWLIVVCAALALSTWSLYWIGRHYGLPPAIAGLVSACFDGAALISADLAMKYARTYGDSGLGPRVCVFTFAGLSAYLNSQHAVLAHLPFAARLLYAAPPVIAVVVFELSTRWSRRGALRAAGRVPAALPVFDRWAWVLYPVRTIKTIKRIVSVRLDNAERPEAATGNTRQRRSLPANTDEEQSSPRPGSPASHSRSSKKRAHVPNVKTSRVRAWARTRGMRVGITGPISADIIAAYEAAASQDSRGELLAASNGHHHQD